VEYNFTSAPDYDSYSAQPKTRKEMIAKEGQKQRNPAKNAIELYPRRDLQTTLFRIGTNKIAKPLGLKTRILR
jgi:hypothetical protein